jgi:putative glutamine amidotransferase
MQLLNVIFNGDLIQHIEDEIEDAHEHETKPYDKPGHDLIIEKDTLLNKIAKTTKSAVNSSHHQAVKNIGKDLVISARSSDGVIEAIEHKDKKFILGVQWHPEYLISDMDKNIFKQFIINS